MGTKTPPPDKPDLGTRIQGACDYPTSSERSAQAQLLGRIADVLQVPLETLYQPLSAVDRVDQLRSIVVGDGIGEECVAMLHAFIDIEDPEERRRLLTLVQQAARPA